MPSQATSQRVTVTVLAALWVSLGRCGESESPGAGCDYGKVSLDMDLPEDAVFWDCTSSTWPESTQRLPSVDTVFDPEPASQVCVDKPISYNHTIPNSGAYRPVGAESGEYLYCPPQRWLNNLHHGATVLLYHPCAPLHERNRLSVLARSCLPDYIITPYLQLSKHMPIALVSWGRTLELSTMASADICDWLETAQTRRNTFDGVSKTRKYNLLLTWSAGLHRQEQPRKMKESLRQCCELIIPSLLNGATVADMEFSMKKEHLKQFKEGGKSRHIRAALKNHNEGRTTTANIPNSLPSWTNRNIPQRTGNVQNYSTTSGPSADSLPGKRTLSDPQSKMQNLNRGHTPRPTAPLGSVISETTLRTHSLGTSQSQKGRLTLHKAALQPSPKPTDLRNPDLSAEKDVLADSVKSAQNPTVRPEAETVRSKDEGTHLVKHKDKDFDKHSMKVNHSKEKHFDEDHTADGKTKDNEVVDVKEREVEHKEIHSDRHSHRKSENTGFDSVAKSKSELQPQQNPQPTRDSQPDSLDCDSCKAGEQCDCNKALGAETRAAVSNKGLPRTPRTDEAVWAAAALGFLLVLLTLSVLHTRLYRHWRTTPSLYWHDPRQDYDSVADVIRRRLRIANRRRKRGRRQECVLLPSSSSSDEHP